MCCQPCKVVILVLFWCTASSSQGDSHPRVLARTDARFEKAIASAKQALRISLEREAKGIENSEFKNVNLEQSAQEQIKAELKAFNQKGYIPFSKSSRSAARKYLAAVAKANQTLTNAYASHRKHLLSLGKLGEAEVITETHELRSAPRLIAIWNSTSRASGLSHTWKLYDDLTAEVIGSEGEPQPAKWKLNSSGVTVVQQVGGTPKSESWSIDDQGKSFVAKQGRKEVYRGELVTSLRNAVK